MGVDACFTPLAVTNAKSVLLRKVEEASVCKNNVAKESYFTHTQVHEDFALLDICFQHVCR